MHDNSNNPFQAPTARVADATATTGDFSLEGRRVPAGRGAAWFSRGWELFRQDAGTWIGMMLVFGAIVIALSMIPLLGLAVNVVVPVFAGGLMLGCRAQDTGEGLRFNHLFAGFANQFGNLAILGLLYLAGLFAIGVVIAVVAGVAGLGAALGGVGRSGFGVGMLLAVLIGATLAIPLAMATWFAPALVALQEVSPVQAMKASFAACLRNILPFLVYGFVGLLLAIVATLPLMLGWLALGPTLYGSIYAAYQDIFTASE